MVAHGQYISVRYPLPFSVRVACERGHHEKKTPPCMAVDTRSKQWLAPFPPPTRPNVSAAALEHACQPLTMYNVQGADVSTMLGNQSFWNAWLPWGTPKHAAAGDARTRRSRCVEDLTSWQPQICQLPDVHVAGAAQVLFNSSHYFGTSSRVTSAIRARGINGVQARVAHAVLTRNEFGAGYYHLIFDTLASLAWLLPQLQDDPSATYVLNPCSLGREANVKTANAIRGIAPDFDPSCKARTYASEMLAALGVPPERVLHSPYTRQRAGPAFAAGKATFMCAHPFRPTFQRDFWYVRQLRSLLHRAFALTPVDNMPQSSERRGKHGAPRWPGWAGNRLILLVTRRGCASEGCDTSRTVRQGSDLLTTLQHAFPAETVLAFDGSRPVKEQAQLFHQSSVVAGPHGAAFSNAIYMTPGTSLIEFHRQRSWQAQPRYQHTKPVRGSNSPLYALLCRALELHYWVVVDTVSEASQRGYNISRQALVDTVVTALAFSLGKEYHAQQKTEAKNEATPLLGPVDVVAVPSWIRTKFA